VVESVDGPGVGLLPSAGGSTAGGAASFSGVVAALEP